MKKFALFLLVLCLLASCTSEPSASPEASPPPADTESPSPEEPSPSPLETVNLESIEMKESIQLDQLGYRPNDPKIAVLPETSADFQVVRVSDGAILLSADASDTIFSAASLEMVRLADFSEITEAGEYCVVTGAGKSHPFLIDENPYGDLRAAILEFFNYQRCGIAIDMGIWSHEACHTTLATVIDQNGAPTGETLDVTGGWHDAGDFGRYIVPAAQTVAQLLLGYELSPNPDEELLEITWYEVEWMLKMQDQATGGVYHKVSNKSFGPLPQSPEEETGEQVISPISATATADFAASMALASRFYPDHKDQLLDAAVRAWEWCVANPEYPGFRNPRNVSTGGYGDGYDGDERFWAACELFAATGEETYHDYIKSVDPHIGLGWADMGTFGLYAYLFKTGDNADPTVTEAMRSKLFAAAQDFMSSSELDPYGISLGTNYFWGSNMGIGNNAMTLLLANMLEPDQAYVNTALEHMHYLLGKNALNQSYISGYGEKPMMNPHHRPSVAVGQAVPGMVSGGPNANTGDDPKLNETRAGEPPMKAYIDHIDSYASNEITIYWNSPVYFVLAVLGL